MKYIKALQIYFVKKNITRLEQELKLFMAVQKNNAEKWSAIRETTAELMNARVCLTRLHE